MSIGSSVNWSGGAKEADMTPSRKTTTPVRALYKGDETLHTATFHVISRNDLMGVDRLLFDLLTTKTPHGHEKELYKYLPKPTKTRQRHVDEKGNVTYFVGKVREHKTMFSSHLDTVHKSPGTIEIALNEHGYIFGVEFNREDKDGQKFYTSTILGADDKVGVWIMCKMILANIPGLYVFHVGEEVGGIGSTFKAQKSPKTFINVERCVAFDRMGYADVITQQGDMTASEDFAKCLADELNTNIDEIINSDKKLADADEFAPCSRGVFTDSANYSNIIPECTNLSVGYFRQHTSKEHFDWTWLSKIFLPAVLKIRWADLPTVRTRGESRFSNSYVSTASKTTKQITSPSTQTSSASKTVIPRKELRGLFDNLPDLHTLKNKTLTDFPPLSDALIAHIATSKLTETEKKELLVKGVLSHSYQKGIAEVANFFSIIVLAYDKLVSEMSKYEDKINDLETKVRTLEDKNKTSETNETLIEYYKNMLDEVMEGAVDLENIGIRSINAELNEAAIRTESYSVEQVSAMDTDELKQLALDLQDDNNDLCNYVLRVTKAFEHSGLSLEDIEAWGPMTSNFNQ